MVLGLFIYSHAFSFLATYYSNKILILWIKLHTVIMASYMRPNHKLVIPFHSKFTCLIMVREKQLSTAQLLDFLPSTWETGRHSCILTLPGQALALASSWGVVSRSQLFLFISLSLFIILSKKKKQKQNL